MKSILSSERGSALATSLFFIPFTFLLFSFSTWLFWTLHHQRGLEKICLRGVMQAQEVLVRNNEAILKLNPRARSLEQQSRQVQREIKLAPHPSLKAILLARLAYIKLQQTRLRYKQHSLFQSAKADVYSILQQTRGEMMQHLRTNKRAFAKSDRGLFRVQVRSRHSALKAQGISIAPTYKRGINHSSQQELSINWDERVRERNNYLLAGLIRNREKWTGSCHSHPAKEGLRWIAKIGKARVWLKPLFSL